MKFLLPALLACVAAPILHAQSANPAPDAIYFNGHILTGEGLVFEPFSSGNASVAAKPHFVTALVVSQGKIVAATGDHDALPLAGPSTQKIDLAGAFVMPGFNDAHLHLGGAGRTKLSVDLTGTTSLGDMKTRIRIAASTAAPGKWLTGGGWDHTLWASASLPTRADIDSVSNGHPAILVRIDGHIAIANSAALAAAGITPSTPDPAGGKIDHNAAGQLTGILREDPAMELVFVHVPPPTDAERRQGLELATADAASHGVTSVQDNSAWEDFLVMEQMEKDGKLPIRITEWLPFSAPVDVLKQHRAAHPGSDPMLHTGMLKGFMDGSLGSRTAAMKAPFSDDPGNSGLPRYDQPQLDKMTSERVQAGFQIGFHAIGDRATSMALHAFAQTPSTQARNRVEHAQVVDPADIPRFHELKVIASMQPNHLLTDMHWAESRLGPARAEYSYAWKAFLAAGVPLAFGTDYPVEPVTPFRGVYAAVTRTDEAGKQIFYPQNALTIWQAITAYTQGSAYAEFAENWKGKLEPGYAADFVVLDRDITAIPPPEILKTRVLRTIVGGKLVYSLTAQ
jgi:predicted amidohydrolase YtcJ